MNLRGGFGATNYRWKINRNCCRSSCAISAIGHRLFASRQMSALLQGEFPLTLKPPWRWRRRTPLVNLLS